MPRLPPRFAAIILAFAPLFLQRSWRHARVLLTGAILAPGQRTVTSILRITGLSRERRFVNYHRVLSRAAWCPRAASRILLGLLVAAFVPSGPVVLGIDDTIERRRGKRIAAKGIYRDPVRSSHGHFVKASGLRWLSLMLLAPIPWAGRIWALPFLTALAPSERYCRTRGRRHKKLTDWGRQLVLQARRWLPGRELVVVADSGFAALEFLAAVSRRGVACIMRLRLDAALYDPPPPRLPGNGNDTISLSGTTDVVIGSGTGTTQVTGGAGSAFIAPGSQNLNFVGGAGSAVIYAGTGSDTVSLGTGGGLVAGGTAGRNVLQGGTGSASSVLFGGGNGDVLSARGFASTTLIAGSGNETLTGANSTANNLFYAIAANGGNASLQGGNGADTFVVAGGNTTVNGGPGQDLIGIVASGGGNLTITSFNSAERVTLLNYGANEVSPALSTASVGASTTLTLSDSTRVTFVGVTNLNSSSFI